MIGRRACFDQVCENAHNHNPATWSTCCSLRNWHFLTKVSFGPPCHLFKAPTSPIRLLRTCKRSQKWQEGTSTGQTIGGKADCQAAIQLVFPCSWKFGQNVNYGCNMLVICCNTTLNHIMEQHTTTILESFKHGFLQQIINHMLDFLHSVHFRVFKLWINWLV